MSILYINDFEFYFMKISKESCYHCVKYLFNLLTFFNSVLISGFSRYIFRFGVFNKSLKSS